MIRVGITGGIGSGKTTFCKEWEKLGACVVYADDLAKKLMTEDEELVRSVKEKFGDEAYNEEGELNRAYLAEEAFAKGRVEELNKVVHPVLWKRVNQIAREQEEKGTLIFAKEAAILLKDGRPSDLDYVIIVTADEETRISRVTNRDGSRRKQVKERIRKQQDFEKLTHLCDFLVVNDSGKDVLKEKAREIYNFLSETA